MAKEPVDGIDIPTAAEQGYDVSLTNWRSLSAPSGLEESEREALTQLVLDSVATPEWADAMDRYYWTERIITGDELDTFLKDEETRIRALYEEMGL